MFWSGAAYYFMRGHVKLSPTVAVAIVVLLGLVSQNKFPFHFFYYIAVPYLIYCLSYLPGGLVRRYNRLGDYSYGVYIYGCLVQQCVAALAPGISIGWMFISSLFFTLALAQLSWHLIESPALALKSGGTRASHRALGLTKAEEME